LYFKDIQAHIYAISKSHLHWQNHFRKIWDLGEGIEGSPQKWVRDVHVYECRSYNVSLFFESVHDLLKFNHYHSTKREVFSCDVVYKKHNIIKLHDAFLPFDPVYETRKCDHSNESYWAVLSCGTVTMACRVVLITVEPPISNSQGNFISACNYLISFFSHVNSFIMILLFSFS